MIPKIIHYCWFGGTEIPEKFQKCIDSWKKLCPDYEIKCWNESNYDVTKNAYMHEAYTCKKLGFVPDYARLDIIYSYGGFYLDTDVELIKSLDELLELDGFCGIEKCSKYVNFGLGFGAQKGNEIIKNLRDFYDNMHFIKKDGTIDTLPSPGINTRFLYTLGYKYTDINIQTLKMGLSELTVFPSEYFCPTDYDTGVNIVTPNTFSIHHYAGSWQSEKAHELRLLSQKYSAKYGKLGAKIAKFFYYIKHDGVFAAFKLLYQSILHRLKKIFYKIKYKYIRKA